MGSTFSLTFSSMDVLEMVKQVQDLTKAEANGDELAHHRLLQEIHKLRFSVETPAEETIRTRFQVRHFNVKSLCYCSLTVGTVPAELVYSRGAGIWLSPCRYRKEREGCRSRRASYHDGNRWGADLYAHECLAQTLSASVRTVL